MAHLNNEAIKKAYEAFGNIDVVVKHFRSEELTLEDAKEICGLNKLVKKSIFSKKED